MISNNDTLDDNLKPQDYLNFDIRKYKDNIRLYLNSNRL